MHSDWITAWLSEDRFAPYLRLCDGNQDRALALYDWNARLSSALMRDISHFEIALRNTYDRAFNQRWPYNSHWLTHPENPAINPLHQKRNPNKDDRKLKNRNKVLALKEKHKKHKHADGRIIADLEFGFWTSLTAKQWEKELWTPYIRHAYAKGTSRGNIHKSLNIIRQVRNRIAHHEPIHNTREINEPSDSISHNPTEFHKLLFRTFDLIMLEASQFTKNTSTVQEIIGNKPI